MSTQKGVSNEALGTSKGYLRLLLDQDVLEFIALLTDLINLLSKLSLFLQDQACIIGEVQLRVAATCNLVNGFKTRYIFFSIFCGVLINMIK